MLVSASILSNNKKPQDIVKELNKSLVDFIHIDIMDGQFVDNKTWTFGEVKGILNFTNKPLDVHLMVKNPIKYIEDYALLNTEYITFHYEAVKDPKKLLEVIEEIRRYGLKVGISINPETDVKVLFNLLKLVDQVLIMGVVPGKSGQEFIEDTLYKIKDLKEEIIKENLKTIISVDGGINYEIGESCVEAGADMLVSASYIHEDVVNNIKKLKSI